ncbi:MAG: hypothetical protein VX870_10170 [Pseudomonadota bacterium]|nr:hypothetical protein [Pseudomonadota bacterium]
MKLTQLALALTTVLALTACGGGSDSPDTTTPPDTGSGGGDNGGGDNTASGPTISGKVIDGYVKGATVFVDINGNGQLDDGEPNGESSDAGDYKLELTDIDESVEECITYAPIVVDVPVGAIDEDLGEVEEAYTMTLPPINEDAFDSANITPLTSVLWETFQNDFALEDGNADPVLACEQLLNNNELISQFKDRMDQTLAKIVEDYNISQETIYSDFVDSGDTDAYNLAQKIVKGLKMSLAETKAITDESPNAVPLISYLKEGEDWVREEYIFTPASDTVDGEWSDNARVSAKTQIVSDDFEQRFDVIYTYNRRSSFKTIGDASVEVAYFNETCNTADIFEYIANADATETEKVEITNNDDSCIDIRSKRITVSHITNQDQNLGESYTYSLPYDNDAGAFTQFDYMKDFQDRKTELNIDSILADATSYEFSMSEDYDAATLLETFASVETRTRVMDGENLVDTQRVYTSPEGPTWRRKTTFPDGTSEVECKDIGETEWSECNQ